MAKQVIELEIKFDTGEASKNAVTLNEQIQELTDTNKELSKEGKKNTLEFQKNTEAIKLNKTQLQQTNKTINDNKLATRAATGSIEEQRKRLSVLTSQWKRQGATTKEGRKRQRQLGKEVRKLSDALKEQESQVGDNTRSVGNYSESIKEALAGTSGFAGSVIGLGQSLVRSKVALSIAAIGAAAAITTRSMARTAEGERELARATSFVTVIYDGLTLSIASAASSFIEWTGLLGRSGGLIDRVLNQTADLVLAEKDLAIAEAERFIIEKESLKLQEDQRQVRDDIRLSIDERITANSELSRLQEDQLNLELSLSQKAVDLAERRIRLQGDNRTNQLLLLQAQGQIADIEERINGLISEARVNEAGLEKERDDNAANELKRLDDLAKKIVKRSQDEEARQIEAFEFEREREDEKTEQLREDLEERTEAFFKAEEEKTDKLKKEAAKQVAIEKAASDAKLTGALLLSSQVQTLTEESTILAKAAGISQAIIHTFVGATHALDKIPPPLSFAVAATTIAVGLASVQKIIAAAAGDMWTFGSGGKSGVFGGKSHSSGGTKGYFDDGTRVEVEKDEAFIVVNKRDTPLINYLNDINSIHGKSFMGRGGSNYLQDGGAASRFVSSPVNNSLQQAAQLRSIIESLPNPVVFVSDIRSGVSNVVQVEDRATA